ncbi:MAG: hypothetical protein K2G73_02570 [Eubacterium sp.]|nr:hypothetical protein [Eubacterium sp.]
MAGNQRKIEREERREQRERKHKLIVWIVIAVVVLALIIMKICEVNVNSIKDRFTDANGNFTLTEGVITDNFPFSLDASQNVIVTDFNNMLGVLTPNSFTVLESKEASVNYAFEHGYSNPVLSTEGVYSLVYDQGSNNYRLDTTSQAVYEEETAKPILCADVAKNGTVALATTSKEKLCDVTIISKALKEEWSFGISDGYIVDIALNDSGKELAVAVVNSENAELVTTVYTYRAGGSSTGEVQLPSGTLAKIKYSGGNIWTVGDTYLGVIKKGEYVSVFEQGSINTNCYSFTSSGDLLIAYGGYSNSTDCTLSYVKSNGKVKTDISLAANIKDVSATAGLVYVLTTDEIISYNYKNGEEKNRYDNNDSVKSICALGSSVYTHKQSVIDKK